ncbi:hypothetical protein ES703_17673 [subsurface metagenome]
MSPTEKHTLEKEKKQLRGFLSAIRTENNSIGKRLACIIPIIASIRASQVGIELIIQEFEKKLK